MPRVPLAASVSVTLDGSGNGRCRIGPSAHGEVWRPSVASVHVSAPVTNSPECKVYCGTDVNDQNFRDATFTGEQDSTDRVSADILRLNYYVWAVWTGGDPGREATLNVTGEQDIP